ncbi:MAG: hypothetical protein VX938_04080, partial [Myxococcota bacterium]|nr:hypothetical protein [Myxococcota bacterium]
TRTMSSDDVVSMKRFARFWDLVVNSGNFIESSPLVWSRSDSAFQGFFAFSAWLYDALGRTHHIQLHALMIQLYTYLVDVLHCPPPEAALAIARDLHRTRGRKTPRILKPHLPPGWKPEPAPEVTGGLARQSRHAAR